MGSQPLGVYYCENTFTRRPMEHQPYDQPSIPVQNYLDFIDMVEPEIALREYGRLYTQRYTEPTSSLLVNAYEEAVIMYPIDSKNEPESAPSLLSYFAEHGENNALSLTLMALGNLAAVNSEAAAYVYTQCMNRGFMSQEVEEALGIVQNFGIQPVVNQGNVTYLGVARRMRAG